MSMIVLPLLEEIIVKQSIVENNKMVVQNWNSIVKVLSDNLCCDVKFNVWFRVWVRVVLNSPVWDEDKGNRYLQIFQRVCDDKSSFIKRVTSTSSSFTMSWMLTVESWDLSWRVKVLTKILTYVHFTLCSDEWRRNRHYHFSTSIELTSKCSPNQFVWCHVGL